MDRERWIKINREGEGLTEEEFKEGWHFCITEWDDMLIGPGMPEFEICNCMIPKKLS